MSTIPPEPGPAKGGYRLIAPDTGTAEPYMKGLGLHIREVVTEESQLFGFDPKSTTLILVDRPWLEACDENLLFRANQMHLLGARMLTYAEALFERRTYVRGRRL